jgi:hypothetical protein
MGHKTRGNYQVNAEICSNCEMLVEYCECHLKSPVIKKDIKCEYLKIAKNT